MFQSRRMLIKRKFFDTNFIHKRISWTVRIIQISRERRIKKSASFGNIGEIYCK